MSFILGLCLGSLLIYLLLSPRIRKVVAINTETQLHNEELEEKKKALDGCVIAAERQLQLIEEKKQGLISQKENLEKDIKTYYDLIDAEKVKFEKYKDSLQEQLDLSAEKMSQNYSRAEEEYRAEYEETLKDYIQNFQNEIIIKTEELKNVNSLLEDLRRKTTAAVEAYKREQEKKEKQDFYRIKLSEADAVEIEKLREVAKILRDSEPLNKVIWKVYYENPFSDLCGRVVGKKMRTGIYKITNIKNNMCYVGQAKDIASRWNQHCKRGVGADTPTKNKIYPAMLEYGIENFTFEIIEDCELEKLGEREKFWQDYFKAKEYGYSIK